MTKSTTIFPASLTSPGCKNCANPAGLPFDFSYAYQPIVDISNRAIFAHEALVRGANGESALSVLDQVNADNRYLFDQTCREKAIRLAANLKLPAKLSINFLPNAIYRPELCIRSTLIAAQKYDVPLSNIIFEAVEGEMVADGPRLAEILHAYQKIGFLTAIDDFGAGYAGLNLLADFQPDIIKLDMGLIRAIDASKARQTIVKALIGMTDQLGIMVIAEGVETAAEAQCLEQMGIRLMQGFAFSRPLFENFAKPADIVWPT